jgi:hypothetical protein
VVGELIFEQTGFDGVVAEGEEAGEGHLNDEVLFGVVGGLEVGREAPVKSAVDLLVFNARDERGPRLSEFCRSFHRSCPHARVSCGGEVGSGGQRRGDAG